MQFSRLENEVNLDYNLSKRHWNLCLMCAFSQSLNFHIVQLLLLRLSFEFEIFVHWSQTRGLHIPNATISILENVFDSNMFCYNNTNRCRDLLFYFCKCKSTPSQFTRRRNLFHQRIAFPVCTQRLGNGFKWNIIFFSISIFFPFLFFGF